MVSNAQFLARWEIEDVRGVVVVVDVLRAFTTAAYAFAAGASEIWLVATVDEALDLSSEIPNSLTMGESHGRKPEGFDFSNSPVMVASADLEGRILIQRTSAGTQGVVAARKADRLFAASLVCATATAKAVNETDLGDPTYVITGRFEDASSGGEDDLSTAVFIEQIRCGQSFDAGATSNAVRASPWARQVTSMEAKDAHPEDVSFATNIDLFAFAMEVERIDGRLRLVARNI
jgi:2-phosphosulfolactate phosphatase